MNELLSWNEIAQFQKIVYDIKQLQLDLKMGKGKNAEVYSFKAISSQSSSLASLVESRRSQVEEFNYKSNNTQQSSGIKNMIYANSQYQNKLVYRHQKQYSNKQPQLNFAPQVNLNFKKQVTTNSFPMSSQKLHPKILSLDQQIQQNIKRRLQLQEQVNRLKQLSQQNQREKQQKDVKVGKERWVVEREFGLMERETDFVDGLLMAREKGYGQLMGNKDKAKNGQKKNASQNDQKRLSGKTRQEKLAKSIDILNDDDIDTILKKEFQQTNGSQGRLPKSSYPLQQFMNLAQKPSQQIKPQKKQPSTSFETAPPALTIQQLLTKLTFPQIPTQNIEKLLSQCRDLYANYKEHADVMYLMMVGNYHLQRWEEVRRYFKQLLRFKKFQMKAYWIAAQTQFNQQNYETCLKLAGFCIQNLDDRFLPRFLYLTAKCYYELGNFSSSIVCYNQLIRTKPKVAQYYLQRAILYDKLGYEEQCKEDYLMFGILKPQAKEHLKEKIVTENNEGKRKELISIYKKMV